ncbi:MAG: radical SAM protein [Candidatus Omnitrophica bacterium]|nr:radical SAM protein [Candidatus Omnitrophota bacterium]
MAQKKVFVTNNSLCERRVLDAARLVRYFKTNGCLLVAHPGEADYLIFVSCAVDRPKEEQCFKIIEQLRSFPGELIITGCLGDIAPTRFRKVFSGRYIAAKDVGSIGDMFDSFSVSFSDIPEVNSTTEEFIPSPFQLVGSNKVISVALRFIGEFEPSWEFARRCAAYAAELGRDITGKGCRSLRRMFLRPGQDSKNRDVSRGLVRISTGCLGNCTYCSFRKAIGPLTSKPIEVCLDEYQRCLARGYRKIDFVGSDVGAYGLDRASSLPELLRAFAGVENGRRPTWVLWDFNPVWAIKYKDTLLEFIRQGRIGTIWCSVESGSSRILGLMKRYADVERIILTLNEFKQADPKLSLHTDIIVGFPTETDDDFDASLDMIRRAGFTFVSLFAYHDAESAAASRLDGKISEAVIRRRLHKAISFHKRHRIQHHYSKLKKA